MKLHHAGFVVADRKKFIAQLIFETPLKEVFDPIQKAFLVLLKNYCDCLIELIEPCSETSPTYNFLKKHGSGFHHFCYQLEQGDSLRDLQQTYKLIKVFGPVPAVLFEGAEVVFYFDRNKQLVEFILPGPQ